MKTNSIIIFRTYKMNARNKMSVLNNDDNKLIRFLMGNQVEKDFTFYSLEEHPIEGRVTVYSIQGEGAYVMSKLTELTAGTEILIRKISAEENPFLVKFYNFEKNVGPVVKCSQQCSETTKNICISYWQFFNYDLNSQLKKKKHKLSDNLVWDLIEGTASAGEALRKHETYLQWRPKMIQFQVDMSPKVYWAGVESQNLHRSYFRFFYFQEERRAYYSPEELVSLKSGVQNLKINLEKCSVFSLGMTLIKFFSRYNLADAYNYKDMEIDKKVISQALSQVKERYGSKLAQVLASMVEFLVFKRASFASLIQTAQTARGKHIQIASSNKKGSSSTETESKKSAASKKN